MTVVVVGAGIVGASIAYHLARDGVPVTVIARDAGVTASSFAWIGGTDGDGWPGGAADLRPFVLAGWRRLAESVPGISVRWCGSLQWPAGAGPGTPPAAPHQSAPHQSALPAGRARLGPGEVAVLEPQLNAAAGSLNPAFPIYTPSDGGVDAAAAARALLVAARECGARVVSGATVTAVRDGGVMSSVGWHPASAVVLAAGAGIGALEPRVSVPPSPALLLRLRGPAGLVRTIVATPSVEVRALNDDGVLLATTPLGPAPDRSWTALRARAGEALSRLRAAFGAGLRLTGWSVGDRPMPAGGPIIGRLDSRVYVAAMHSAVCLAPVAGRLIAQEIGTGRPAPELAGCRPSRS